MRWAKEMKRKCIILVLVVGTLSIACSLLPRKEYTRINSPDGRLVVVARYRAIWSLLPLFPGQAGDHPGWISIELQDGTVRAEFTADMVSMIHDLRWRDEMVSIPNVGTWAVIE